MKKVILLTAMVLACTTGSSGKSTQRVLSFGVDQYSC